MLNRKRLSLNRSVVRITVIVQSIFMNICKSIILIIAIYGHLRIDKNVVPGSAEKVKRNSAEYYQAYSEASHWVSNARTPLLFK